MRTITGVAVACVAALGWIGHAGAIDIGSAAKTIGKEAGKGVVEKKINDDLAGQNCTFKGKGNDVTCNLNGIVAVLKAGHTAAEKSGTADFNIKVEAWGPDSATAKTRADAIRAKVRPLFGSWDYDVYEKVGGNGLVFSVKLN